MTTYEALQKYFLFQNLKKKQNKINDDEALRLRNYHCEPILHLRGRHDIQYSDSYLHYHDQS